MFWWLPLQNVEIIPTEFERQMAHIRKHISIALPTKCCLNSPPDHWHIKMLCLSCPSCHTFRYCSQTLARWKLPLTAQEEAETEAPKTLPPAPASSLHFPLSNSHILSRSLTPRLLPFPSLSSPFLNVCLPAFLNLNLDLNSHLACSSTHTPLDKSTHHLHSPDHRPTRASLFYEILPTKVTVISYTRSNHRFGPY